MPVPLTGISFLIVIGQVVALILAVSMLVALALLAYGLWKTGTPLGKLLRMSDAQAKRLEVRILEKTGGKTPPSRSRT